MANRRLAVALLLIALPAAVAGAAQNALRLPAPVYRTVAVAAGGRIYVLGGHDSAGGTISDIDVFNPATGTSRHAGRLALPTHGAAAANLGGPHSRLRRGGDVGARRGTAVRPRQPPCARGRPHADRTRVTAAVVGRRAILVGGFDGVGPPREVWATANGRDFRVVAHLPQPVRYPAVAAVGSAVYVFGGLITGGEYTGTFTSAIQRIYLPTGTARIVGHLPTPLAHAMAAVVSGRVYVLGGSPPGGPSAAIRRFDPVRNRIALVGRLPHSLTDAAVATIGRTVYLLGGISREPLATIIAVRPR